MSFSRNHPAHKCQSQTAGNSYATGPCGREEKAGGKLAAYIIYFHALFTTSQYRNLNAAVQDVGECPLMKEAKPKQLPEHSSPVSTEESCKCHMFS